MEEEIEILDDFKDFLKEEFCNVDIYIKAIENLLTRYKQYENKLMFALSPTTGELALETQRNFKKIIAQNIDEDTYTIKKELKKYWNHMDTYWEGK